MFRFIQLVFLSIGCCIVPTTWLAAANAGTSVDFRREIAPILSDNCFHCHGPDSNHREADLRLDLQETAHESAIDPGSPETSELTARIISDDPDLVMPPPDSGKSLTAEEKDQLATWVREGATYQRHWSFEKPVAPKLPEPSDRQWLRNPIDTFVLSNLEANNLRPSAEANKTTLIRRVTLDLTGLPPTVDEVDAFLLDNSPQAFETVVDRLLESDRYGERMAQVWLDAARYADTMGYQADWERTQWRWRSWVIDAYNANMPFDQFTIEQLAGDLLPNPTIEQQIATGFNRNHRINDEGGIIPEEYLVEYLVDRVETTAGTWLGMTFGCARCHDHKFDPLSQKDFYRFLAFFNSVPEKGKDGRKGYAVPFIRVAVRGMQDEYEDVQSESDRLSRELSKRIDSLDRERQTWILQQQERAIERSKQSQTDATTPLAQSKAELPAGVADAIRETKDKRTTVQVNLLKDHFASVSPTTKPLWRKVQAAKKRLTKFEKRFTTNTMVMREMPAPRPTHILNRGVYDQPGELVKPGVPVEMLGDLEPGVKADRLGLAQWLVSGNHPLTSRVVVNRYWAMFFGRGLVETTEDFGLQGSYPSHPDLLDWLATEYPRMGWDTKELLRMIVTSATYRQSSNITDEMRERDPKNRFLSRMTRFRLPAEMIRDQALFASNLLVEKIGGPSVKPYQPEGLWSELSFQSKTRTTDFYVQGKGDDLFRRSIYTFWKRSVPPPTMATFDAPTRDMCVLSRPRTNTPLQALALMNDPTFVEACRGVAQKAMRKHQEQPEQLRHAFKTILAREPDPEEIKILVRALEARTKSFRGSTQQATDLLGIGETDRDTRLPTAEFAAMTTCVMTMMNLDEAIQHE